MKMDFAFVVVKMTIFIKYDMADSKNNDVFNNLYMKYYIKTSTG